MAGVENASCWRLLGDALNGMPVGISIYKIIFQGPNGYQ